MGTSDAFDRLRPLCVQLAKQCSVECIHKIVNECKTIDRINLQVLQEYLLFPVRLAIKNGVNDTTTVECVKFMKYVFSNTTLTSWNLFSDVVAQLSWFFQSNKNISEELMLAICECIEAMVSNSDREVCKHIYSTDFVGSLAFNISMLLEVIKNERFKDLRLASLKALSSFVHCSDKIKCDDLTLTAGNSLASFLPGISIALNTVICGDIKQSHTVTVAAIKLFAEFIALTVGDQFIKETDGKEVMIKGKEDQNKLVQCVTRNKAWAEQISGKLVILVTKINNVVSHEHWKVRMALVHYAEKLLIQCSSSLSNCISPLLQLLFALSVDDYKQVSNASHTALTTFSKHVSSIKSFNVILEDDIFVISSQLIKIYLKGYDVEILARLRILHGYFQLLGSSVNMLLYSMPHLDRFMISLLSLIKLDVSDLNFFAEHFPTINYEESFAELWPKRQFKYFHDQEIMSRVSAICQLLGQNGDVELLIDYLIDKLDSHYKNESLLLITCILKGRNTTQFPIQKYIFVSSEHLPSIDSNVSKHVVSVVLESLLSLDLWRISFSDYCKTSDDIPEAYKENILQVCLILECLAVCSQIIRQDFRPTLIDVLCGVMEKAGCSNLMISHTGKLALYSIARSCGYNSVTNLIIENADYLVDSITSNLSHIPSHSETVVVLQVIVDNCDHTVLPLMRDPIYKMLKTLDLNQEKALVIMKAIKAMVLAMKRWFQCPNKDIKEGLKPLDSSLKTQILEHHRLKQISTSFLDEDSKLEGNIEEEKETEDDDINGSEKKKLPLHVEVMTSVLNRCVHMMSSSSMELTVLTLEIISASLQALKDNIDDVLPCVHKIWSPLVCRFSGSLIVSMKAFEVLVVISNHCGDFIKSRTMKEVWPKFLAFLKSQAVISSTKRNSSDYQMTTAFKAQHLLLSGIGNIAQRIELTEKEFEMLCLHCFAYLNYGQPELLQMAAKQCLDKLWLIDPDAGWFHFHEYFGMKTQLIPPNSGFVHHMFLPQTSNKIGTITCLFET